MKKYIISYQGYYGNIKATKYLCSFTTYGLEVYTTKIEEASIFTNKNTAKGVINRHKLSHCEIIELK